MSNRKFINLKIISINVNSIIANRRRASLLSLLERHCPDVVLLSETKLNAKHMLQFKDYNVIRNDRLNRGGGGTAILIKKGIKFKRVNINNKTNNIPIEHTSIKIFFSNDQEVIIVSAYATSGNHAGFISYLSHLFDSLKLQNINNYYIIAGDLNAKHESWGNTVNNQRGESLRCWLDKNDIEYRIKLYCLDVPSFPRGHSFLDIYLADWRLEFTNASYNNRLPSFPYDSDHNALTALISISEDDLYLECEDEEIIYNFGKVNWKMFTSSVNENICLNISSNRIMTLQEIENSIDELNNILCTALKNLIPKACNKNSVEVYYNFKIRKLKKIKNKILTLMHREQKNGLMKINTISTY